MKVLFSFIVSIILLIASIEAATESIAKTETGNKTKAGTP